MNSRMVFENSKSLYYRWQRSNTHRFSKPSDIEKPQYEHLTYQFSVPLLHKGLLAAVRRRGGEVGLTLASGAVYPTSDVTEFCPIAAASDPALLDPIAWTARHALPWRLRTMAKYCSSTMKPTHAEAPQWQGRSS